jgi:hypothetical protein
LMDNHLSQRCHRRLIRASFWFPDHDRKIKIIIPNMIGKIYRHWTIGQLWSQDILAYWYWPKTSHYSSMYSNKYLTGSIWAGVSARHCLDNLPRSFYGACTVILDWDSVCQFSVSQILCRQSWCEFFLLEKERITVLVLFSFEWL